VCFLLGLLLHTGAETPRRDAAFASLVHSPHRDDFALVQLQAQMVVRKDHGCRKGNATVHSDEQHALFAPGLTFDVPIRPALVGSHHFRFLDFFRRMSNHQSDRGIILSLTESSASAKAAGGLTLGVWFVAFLFAIWSMAMLTRLLCNNMEVPEQPDAGDFQKERGRPCCNYLCAALLFFLCFATFWMTILNVAMVNTSIKKEPTTMDGNTTVTKFPIQDPGQRGFQASEGVALSVVIACVTMWNWRCYGAVRIASALLAQFVLRGGTIAIIVALVFEIFGSIALSAVGLAFPLLNMLLVGFSEEGAKMAAVVFSVWLSADAIGTQPGCCLQCWRSLVESPRALMLAGLSVGYGFMIVENAEYLISSASTPGEKRTSPGNTPDEMQGGAIVNFFTCVTILIRVLLNIHPWLAGYSAARIADVAFKQRREKALLGCSELLWAVWPSAVIHAAYDFLIVAVPFLGLFCPPLFWYFSRRWFYFEWDQVEPPSEALGAQAPPGDTKTGARDTPSCCPTN